MTWMCLGLLTLTSWVILLSWGQWVSLDAIKQLQKFEFERQAKRLPAERSRKIFRVQATASRFCDSIACLISDDLLVGKG
jgi:hypothetical protein